MLIWYAINVFDIVSFPLPVSSSAGQTPRKMRHAGNQMDVFCSQCCKRVSLLNDLENRLKNLKTNRYYKGYSLYSICYER